MPSTAVYDRKIQLTRNPAEEPEAIRDLAIPDDLNNWCMILTAAGSRLIVPRMCRTTSLDDVDHQHIVVGQNFLRVHPAGMMLIEFIGPEHQKALLNFADYFNLSIFDPIETRIEVEAVTRIVPNNAVLLRFELEGAPGGKVPSVFDRMKPIWSAGYQDVADKVYNSIIRKNSPLHNGNNQKSSLIGPDGRPLG